MITIPESPPDLASRSQSPILTRIPESPIKCGEKFENEKCCKTSEDDYIDAKRPKLSPTNKENSSGFYQFPRLDKNKTGLRPVTRLR